MGLIWDRWLRPYPTLEEDPWVAQDSDRGLTCCLIVRRTTLFTNTWKGCPRRQLETSADENTAYCMGCER